MNPLRLWRRWRQTRREQRAWRRWRHAHPEHFALVCRQEVTELGAAYAYRCSLPTGHNDYHEAQGPDGEVYARWP